MGVTGVIADECPRCQRITRCLITEEGGVFAGIVLGIPFVLPLSSTRCVCGECGCEFRSRSISGRVVLPEHAAGLDLDTLLGLTNPELKKARTLAQLRAVPRLKGAFLLLDQLPSGSLRSGLETALAVWADLGEAGQSELLERVEACARAEGFARAIAGRHPSGVVVGLLGAFITAGVWAGVGLTVEVRGIWGWILLGAAGLMAGGLPCALIWHARDRRWVREVLLPEADRAGVCPGWLLTVLEGAATVTGTEDKLARLRYLGPVIRTEWAAAGGSPGAADIGFGLPSEVIVPRRPEGAGGAQ
jgi:hypothetical protein